MTDVMAQQGRTDRAPRSRRAQSSFDGKPYWTPLALERPTGTLAAPGATGGKDEPI